MIRILFPWGISELSVALYNNGTTLTCEDVKWLCLKTLRNSGVLCDSIDEEEDELIGILPAFGLMKAENELVWLAPNYVFEEINEHQKYKFRVRHRPPLRKIYVENNFLSELFVLQALEDFSTGELGKAMVTTEVDRDIIMTLALFTIIMQSSLPLRNRDVIDKEYKIDNFGVQYYKKFSKEIYNKIVPTKNKITRKFDHFVYYKEFRTTLNIYKKENYSVLYYKTKFITLLLENYPYYCFDRYAAFQPDTSSQVEVNLFQNDSVESNQTVGIYINGIRQCGLEAIDSATMKQSKDGASRVELNLRGPKTQDKSLVFKDKDIASSFITTLQGCMILSIRPDVNICQKFTSPFVEIRGKLKSFCPMIHSRAMELLKNENVHRAENEWYRFMIYQSMKMNSEGHFQVATDSEEPVCHIKYLKGQGFRVYSSSSSDTFPDHLALRRHLTELYGQQLRPDFVIQEINPESMFFVDRKGANQVQLSIEMDEHQTKTPACIYEEDLGPEMGYIESYDEHLKLRIVPIGDDKRVEVLLVARTVIYNEALYTGMAKLGRLYRAHPSVVLGFYGPVFAHTTCNSYILEHSSFGNLVKFMERNFENVTTYQKMKLALEIVNIFCTLTQRAESTATPRLLHGNIRGKNLWVFKRHGRYYLKLGDPGLVSYYNTLLLNKPDNDHRIPWLSPQRRQNLAQVTIASECYAIATSIAEIFYGTDDFRSLLHCDDTLLMTVFMKPEFKFPLPKFPISDDKAVTKSVEDITTELWKVLTLCWDPDPDKRPSPIDLKASLLRLVEESSHIQEETRLEHLKAVILQLHKKDGISVQQRISNLTSMEECRMFLMQSHKLYASKLSYKIEEFISNGHFGIVYKGKLFTTKGELKVAIKTYKIDQDKIGGTYMGNLIIEFIKEFKVSASLEHENIVKTHCWTYTDIFIPEKDPVTHEIYKKKRERYWIIMEFMNRGKLTDFVKVKDNEKSKNINILLELSLDIAKGMEYCEKRGVVHCDLATRNVLLDDSSGSLVAKVADFGLAKVLQQEKNYYYAEGIFGQSRPIYWYPPEYLLYQREGVKSSGIEFTKEGDVWAYGTTLWEIFNKGKNPHTFYKKNNLENACPLYKYFMDDKERLPKEEINDDIYKLMVQCWHEVPGKRPRFFEIQKLLLSIMSKYR